MNDDRRDEDDKDDLLRAIERIVKKDDARSIHDEDAEDEDEELERLCAGDLPEDRVRALEARAARDPGLARKLAAYRPLDARFRAGVAASVAAATAAATPDPRPARRGLPRRVLGWVGGTGALAAAAAIALWVGGHRDGDPSPARALPAYHVEVLGGDRDLRGPAPPARPEPGGAIRLRPESRLELLLRPATAAEGPITVTAFVAPASDGGGSTATAFQPIALPVTISSGGAVRVAGAAASLFGERRGPWRLRLLVTAGKAPPERAPALISGDSGVGPGWQWLGVDVLLVDPSG